MLESLFNKVSLFKKETPAQSFPVKSETFLRTPFLQNTSGGCFCMCDFLFCMETYNTIQATEKMWLRIEMKKEMKKNLSHMRGFVFYLNMESNTENRQSYKFVLRKRRIFFLSCKPKCRSPCETKKMLSL